MSIPKTSTFTLKRIVENLGKIPDKGFGEDVPQMTTEQKKKLMEMASMYENYGQAIRNEDAIVNSAKGLTELCELAEMYALNDAGDWFQQDIVKKDMKDLKRRVMEYNKVAKEGYARMQQLGVMYEDIGHILGRYYSLKSTPQEGGTYTPVKGDQKQSIQSEDSGQEPSELVPDKDLPKCPKCGRTMYGNRSMCGRCEHAVNRSLGASTP